MGKARGFLKKLTPVRDSNFDNAYAEIMNGLARIDERVRSIEMGIKQLQADHSDLIWRVMRIEERLQEIEQNQYETLDPRLYENALSAWFTRKTGRILDLDNPITYNEKIQWLKLYDNNPAKTMLADKVAVRDYVSETIGDEYLIPVLGVYDSFESIDFDSLPDQFVLKANHGCGYNAIVTDKESEDMGTLRAKADSWLNSDFTFHNGFELQYKDIPRKLFIEEYCSNQGKELIDYKFWCFDGKVVYIMLIFERRTGVKMVFFDREWNALDMVYSYPKYEGKVEKPAQLEKMIELAERLSQGFPHVRVDLYLLDNGDIKFGEMTFTSASGTCKWNPPEADYEVGKHLNLPKRKET